MEDFVNITQNGMQCKTDELLASRIFHSMFLDHSSPRVTKTVKRKTMNKGDYHVHAYICVCVCMCVHKVYVSKYIMKNETGKVVWKSGRFFVSLRS